MVRTVFQTALSPIWLYKVPSKWMKKAANCQECHSFEAGFIGAISSKRSTSI